MTAPLLREVRGPALWLTLNRPDARNTLDRALVDALRAALAEASDAPSVRAVVLTGAGDRAFCAGADLKAAARADGGSIFAATDEHNPLVLLYRSMRDCAKPIVGRVNGAAVGGGLGLVAGCDLVWAADHARFGMPEVKVGLFPMMITSYLIRQLPRRVYLEMAMLGELLGAADAERYHLVNRAVPAAELDAAVEGVVRKLCDASPQALRAGKRALDAMQDLDLDAALAFSELAIEKLAATDEAREGMTAFAEKRPPRWRLP